MSSKLLPIGQNKICIVDADLLTFLKIFTWYPTKTRKCWYACAMLGEPHHHRRISMHRLIAMTPRGQVCHHRDRNSLNNTKSNLVNMTQEDHKFLHLNNRLSVKFE